jgi:hypothetical protein
LYSVEQVKGADGAGARGVFHRMENPPSDPAGARIVWTRYEDGRTFAVPDAMASSVNVLPTGSDVLARRIDTSAVELWDAADRTSRTVRVPEGQNFLVVYGSTVVTYTKTTAADGTTVNTMHFLSTDADGGTRDLTVAGLPAGSTVGAPLGGDDQSVFFLGKVDGTTRVIEADVRTGAVKGWSVELPAGYTLGTLSPGRIAMFSGSAPQVLVLDRSDLGKAPASVLLDNGAVQPRSDLALVGDWLLYRPRTGTNAGTVRATPIAGGDPVTLVTHMNRPGISVAPGGTAVVIGKPDGEQALQRITPDDTGRPVVSVVKRLPPPAARIRGIALTQGRLLVTDEGSGRRDDYVRTVDSPTAASTPRFGDRSSFTPGSNVLIGSDCKEQDVACSAVHGTTDGRLLWVEHAGGEDLLRANGPGTYDYFALSVPAGSEITDVSGKYVLYAAAGKQYVVRLDNAGAPVVTRDAGAAAVWGETLWTPDGTTGKVAAYDLTARKALPSVDTGAGCAPDELQALGRWLYWSCGPQGPAGVYDRTSGRTVPVPAGESLLGDGYVVTHDKTAGRLTLTTVADGTPATRVVGDMPDTGVSQRHVRWTVDESGTNAAYVDDQERVHLVPSGVPAQPLTLLAPPENAAEIRATTQDAVAGRVTKLLLSKSVADWTFTVRSKATGAVVDTVKGGAAQGKLTVDWHGHDPKATGDVFLPNGDYTWTVTARPADGVGPAVVTRGAVTLRGAGAVRRDHVATADDPDGRPDLLTLNSKGQFTFQQGTGKGDFSRKVSAGGWPTSALAVPFGDLNKDLCNDVLVRMTDGSLRGYRPGCGQALTPTTAYTKLGTGWNAYNVLTSPGDLTGDGRADLLGRKASTGDIYVWAAKSDGTLAAGKKIRSAWTTYTHIVGAGDLNGDGIGDVLARRKDGTLFRYEGKGDGTLKDRVTVFTAWGASYTTLVGVGDITGDGLNDLVVRDGSGRLFRNDGKGNGSFTSRTQIATGWTYKGVF